MILQTLLYHRYERGLPQNGNYILGQESEDSIIVYQAFNNSIADYAVKNQRFGGDSYSFSRMTWIKPNFLWMMYRSGWATKPNQERILAIKMSKEGFLDLLENGVYSSFQSDKYSSKLEWEHLLAQSEVRIQWDPDHNPVGDKLSRRAIQIGIKGQSLIHFNNNFIQEINDITYFVNKQRTLLQEDIEKLVVIAESIIEIPPSMKEKYSIPETFIAPEIIKLINDFNENRFIEDKEFEALLLEGKLRELFIDYIKNYKNADFSRYLLKKAIDFRKAKKEIMCEDLLTFSFFVSKNKSPQDLNLIMQAKLADFDTWCGFDGEMIFYPLEFEETIKYLQQNKEKLGEKPVEYFCKSYSKEYLAEEISSRAFWYFY